MITPSLTVDQRQRLYSAGVFVISLVIAVRSAWTIAQGAYGETAKFCGVLGLAVVCLFTLRNWRVGIFSFLVWVNFEDLIRKYAGNDIRVYFVKDIIILVTYISYFWRDGFTRLPALKRSLKLALLLWLGWALVEVFNADVPGPIVPLLGLRMSFFYLPMLYLGYGFLDNEDRLKKLLFLLLSSAALVSVGGLAQSMLGLQFLNPEDAGDYLRLFEIRESGEPGLKVPRVTSVFVDPGRYSGYLFVAFFLGVGLLSLLHADKKASKGLWSKVWAWVCWLVVVWGLFISGQKAAILWMALTPVVFLAVYWKQRSRKVRRQLAVLPWKRIVVGGALAFVIFGALFPERFEAAYKLYWTYLNPLSEQFEVKTRPKGYWDDIVTAASAAPLLGHGTGTASAGLQYLSGLRMPVSAPVEGGYAAVLWEWGTVGLALWLWWSMGLLLELMGACRSLASTRYYFLVLSLMSWAFFLLFAWFYLGMQVYQQYLSQALLWFMCGLVLKLQTVNKTREKMEHRF